MDDSQQVPPTRSNPPKGVTTERLPAKAQSTADQIRWYEIAGGCMAFLVLVVVISVPILAFIAGGVACWVCAITLPNPLWAHIALWPAGLFLICIGAGIGALVLDA